MTHRTLSIARFRKVVQLARSTPHHDSEHAERERGGAWRRATRMAEAAGMTLDEALSKLDSEDAPHIVPYPPSQSAPQNPMADFFRDWSEKRREAANRPWPEHPYEETLRGALNGYDIEPHTYDYEGLEPEALHAIKTALPWPRTTAEAVAELRIWEIIEQERRASAEHYSLIGAPFIRRGLLLDMLEAPRHTPEDMLAVAEWIIDNNGRHLDSERLRGEELRRLAQSVVHLCALLQEVGTAPVHQLQPGDFAQRTSNREKRERVSAILSEPGSDQLSLREVARRAGVSVQGVANIKAAMTTSRV